MRRALLAPCAISVLAFACGGCLSHDGEAAWARQAAFARPAAERPAALGDAARHAAAIGDQATVWAILDDLKDDPSHDKLADDCVIQLGNAGHHSAAIATARRVHDPELQRAALFKAGA